MGYSETVNVSLEEDFPLNKYTRLIFPIFNIICGIIYNSDIGLMIWIISDSYSTFLPMFFGILIELYIFSNF